MILESLLRLKIRDLIYSCVATLDLFCNDGRVLRDLNVKAMIKFKGLDAIFDLCSIPDPSQVLRVAYNIWKPFVYKRDITQYDDVANTDAKVLDGIDIQVKGQQIGQLLQCTSVGF